MYYTIYKTTNLVNGKIYIGCHKTKDLDDGYIGSGKYLKHAINKYGINNFTKDILQVFDNAEDMFEMEAQLVNEDFVKDTDTYNIKEGGYGGWDYINEYCGNQGIRLNKYLTQEKRILGGVNAAKSTNIKIKEKRKDPEYDKEYRLKHSRPKEQNGMYNKKHSDKTKMEMSIKSSGENNSQYGTHLYCNQEGLTERFKEGQQPEGWITTTEFKRSKMLQKTNFNKHWYNDGTQNFLRFEKDAEDLIRGRLFNH